jgi:aminoglycoside phosphotransferase (APT) family kinase protein
VREYFLKQPKKWDVPSRRSLDQEAAIYWRTKTDPAFEALQALVPESYGYDPDNSVLTLQYLAEQRNLGRRADRFTPKAARLAGSTMGTFHREMRALAGSWPFGRQKPWYLSLNRVEPQAESEEWSEGRRELLRVVQEHAQFGEALDALRGEWSDETAIHSDWKLDNCLLSEDGRMQVIDWELATWGDPFEDIGTLLQSYWNAWVRRPGRHQLEAIRPALRAFLEGYAEADGRDPAQMAGRAVRFGAARMLQTAYESLDGAASLHGEAARLLQASLNLLTRPEWGAEQLFGADWN